MPEESTLPEEYWPCPLCITTLMIVHGQGIINHERAYRALEKSGLVEDWPENPGSVRTTARGIQFINMILETPLPVNCWIDPRGPTQTAS